MSLCPFYAYYAQPDLSLPLVQCMGFYVGEPFGLVAKFDVDGAYCESGDTFDMVHNLV